MDTIIKLGSTPPADAQRDAIHIAVAPVVAGLKFEPGEAVAVHPQRLADGRIMAIPANQEHAIGIVDPFLSAPVKAGECFWLLLRPYTIRSLRHEWTHPAFGGEPEESQKARSEAWLRTFVMTADCPSYEKVIATALDHLDDPAWGSRPPALQRARRPWRDPARVLGSPGDRDRRKRARREARPILLLLVLRQS